MIKEPVKNLDQALMLAITFLSPLSIMMNFSCGTWYAQTNFNENLSKNCLNLYKKTKITKEANLGKISKNL